MTDQHAYVLAQHMTRRQDGRETVAGKRATADECVQTAWPCSDLVQCVRVRACANVRGAISCSV